MVELDDGRAPGPGRPLPLPLQLEPLEVYDRRGDGHTVSRHCGTTPEVEAERLRFHPGLPATGSFPDVATAQRSVEAAVAAHRGEVERWVAGGWGRLVIAHDMGEVIGNVLERSRLLAGHPEPIPATSVRVVLRANRQYRSGFAVLTAYPVIAAGAAYPPPP